MTLIKPLRLLAMALLITGSGLSMAQKTMPDVTIDGLQLASESSFSHVYIMPGIDLGQYEKIYLDEAYVTFKKNLQRQQSDMDKDFNADDVARIKIELRSLFRDIFSMTLEENGYQLAIQPADDVLQIKPGIINLDITRPEKSSEGNLYSFSESAGEMTLYLELYDSTTGDMVAKVIDRRKDRQTGYFQWQNRISNRAAARRILQVWATMLKQGLDQAHAVGPVPASDQTS